MITRRKLLGSGITAVASGITIAAFAPMNSALSVVLRSAQLRSRAEDSAALPPYAAIFDDTDPVSRSFAEKAASRGIQTFAIGNVSTLWFRELRPRWLRTGRPLIGLTHAAQLLCLEQFACDAGRHAIPRVTAAALQADRWITWTISGSGQRAVRGEMT